MRRAGDRKKLIRSIVGGAIVLFAIGVKFAQPAVSDWLVGAGLIIGAGLISPSFIVDLVKAWRGTSPPPSGGGVSQ